MHRRLPPFSAIRAFEAAARHLSFKAAAEELCLSPSAVSHAVRALEDHLDRQLFLRGGNRLALTWSGEAYLKDLSGLLDGLEQATSRVGAARPRRTLRVLSTPAFAARWLVPRLDRFDAGVEISIRTSDGAPSTDFARNGADVVLHWGDAPVRGVTVRPMMESARYPVVSPDFRNRHGIAAPADLTRHRLLHDEVMDAWADWFRLAGVTPPELPHGPRLAHCELTLTAAEQGQGVALAYDAMARSSLADGRLVRLFDTETLPIAIYSVACPEERAEDPVIKAFSAWMFDEVAAEGTAIQPQRLHATA